MNKKVITNLPLQLKRDILMDVYETLWLKSGARVMRRAQIVPVNDNALYRLVMMENRKSSKELIQ